MRSIGRWPTVLFGACLSVGCGGGDFEPQEPVGCDLVAVDVEETCSDFCARVVGECGAILSDEASCRRGCQTNLSEAYGCSNECGIALEAMFECVAETDDCQDVFDWRDRAPTDHACRAVVDNVGVNCPQL